MLNPTLLPFPAATPGEPHFWLRLLNDKELQAYDDLEKLVIGCEIIAALDTVDLLAA